MTKDQAKIAKKLGLKVKESSETPGIYVNDGFGKRKLNINEIFPEFKDLDKEDFSINSNGFDHA